jgi:hypothetical protein
LLMTGETVESGIISLTPENGLAALLPRDFD